MCGAIGIVLSATSLDQLYGQYIPVMTELLQCVMTSSVAAKFYYMYVIKSVFTTDLVMQISKATHSHPRLFTQPSNANLLFQAATWLRAVIFHSATRPSYEMLYTVINKTLL